MTQRRSATELGTVFRNAVSRVLRELDGLPDADCLNGSRQFERHYVLEQTKRAWQNVALLQEGFEILFGPAWEHSAVLDIGTSPLTFVYRLCFKEALISTIDLRPLAPKRARDYDIVHRQCDLLREAIPFESGQFDVCLFTEVLEHLPLGPGPVFAEIRRVLKPKGLLIFSVPNVAVLSNRIRAVLGRPVLEPVYVVFREERSEQPGAGAPQPRGLGHVRVYTMSETIDLVTHYGFEVLKGRGVSGGGGAATRGGLLRRLLHPFYRAARCLVPNAQNTNLLLCRKTEKKLP